MTYKQIMQAREVRLWVGQIIVPTVGVIGTVLAASPEAREAVKNEFNKAKMKLSNKIKVVK